MKSSKLAKAIAKEAAKESDSNNVFQMLTPEHQRDKPWWRVAESHFKTSTFTEHQIDSYNAFMSEKLSSIITNTQFEYAKDGHSYVVSFENVYIERPEFTEPSGVTRKLKPSHCRIRNLTYNCRIYCDITRYTIEEDAKVEDTKTFPEVFIGAIPCMVLSDYCNLNGKDTHGRIKNDECPQDPGGYFIVNGSEKVLMSQDRMAHNEIFIFKSKDKIKVPIPGTEKNCSLPCAWLAEVRSHSSLHEPNITTTYVKLSAQQLDKGEDQRLYMEIPGLKAPVPWPIVFKALGVVDTDEMISYVCDPNDIPMTTLLMPSLDCPPIESQEDALKYLSEFVLTAQKDQRMPQLKKILRDKMFQNVPQTHMKRFYLGHMTHQLLATVLGRRKEDDRDHYGKKRVDTAGNLINNLFKSIWKRIVREAINHLTKRRCELGQVFLGKITNYIKPPFASGNWTATKSTNNSSKVGVSQILNRHNYVSTISNLRRVITPNDKNSKIIKPRHLHNGQWNLICPIETPEGHPTGLIKNLAMLTIVSLGSSEDQITDWLEMNADIVKLMHNINEIKPEDVQNTTKIFINGSWLASTEYPEDLVAKLRHLKRAGKISFEVSISQTKEGVRIYTDEGRMLAPFFVVEDGKLKDLPEQFTWSDLLDEGIIEYLDASEIETIKHAEYPWDLHKNDTHSIIHPSFLLGVSGSTAPFPDHNQSPRNIYQCLWEEEPVLMADGTRRPIKNVRVGDKVITFDPDTFATTTTTVVNAYTRETDKKIVQVKTVSGRTITVTADHKMMTGRGWVEAGKLLSDDTIAISCEPEHASTIVDNSIVLTTADVEKRLAELDIKPSLIKHHITQLEQHKLLPLRSTHKFLPILSRMLGFILTDGSLGIYRNSPRVQANFGTVYSAEEFEHDIEQLGFAKTKIALSVRPYKIGGRDCTMTTYKVQHETALCSLLLCLGYCPGKLTDQPFMKLPGWVKNGSDAVVREFLSGIQGGDGCQIRWNKLKSGYNFVCGDTLLTIKNEHVQSLRDFMEELVPLFGRFGVETKRVEYPAKYDGSTQCGVRIRSTNKNLQVYYKKIGYRYCEHKTVLSGKVVEYLAFKDTLTKDYYDHITEIRNKIDSGLSNSEIASEYSMATSQVSDIRRSYLSRRNITMRRLKEYEQPPSWEIDSRSCVMLIPIASVKEMPNVRIGDITTASDNHSFIGGQNFCVHNCAMGKQALGVFSTNFMHRYDTSSHVLCYPQRPLVNSNAMRLMGSENLASGQNLVVAVMCAAYNQEDSVVVNQRAIDTGALRSVNYTTYSESCHRKGNTIDEIKRPEKTFVKETRLKGYNKLDADGMSKENTPIAKRDVVVGKVNITTETVRDTSVVVKTNGMEENAVIELDKDDERVYAVYKGSAVVDRAVLTLNADNFRTVKVRVRQMRVPQIGDKVASREAQKGIIGMIVPPENMPYSSKTGMTPDLLMNPNAFPSRMTVGQALESFLGKACSLNGAYADCTPFEREFSVKTVAAELKDYGFDEYGDETFVNGMTGEPMHCKIFVGPTYYQRLKHMVDDKIHARDQDGPRETLTRQPVEGRKRGGGFRMGEMETWCGISHGASSFLIDRLVNNSDGYEMFVCNYCGNPAISTIKTQRYECKRCQQNTAISKIRIPYAFKLLMQELQACGIGVWFNINDQKTLVSGTTPSH